jgi:hypothetical protein
LTDNDLYKELKHQNFKTILLTNATTDEGEDDVTKYFKVQKQWNELLFQWKEEGKVVFGFERYCKTNTTLALVVLTWLRQLQEYFYKIGDANENGDWNVHWKYCPVKAKHVSREFPLDNMYMTKANSTAVTKITSGQWITPNSKNSKQVIKSLEEWPVKILCRDNDCVQNLVNTDEEMKKTLPKD